MNEKIRLYHADAYERLDDVDEMRQRHEQENLTYAQLADEYNITPSAVGFIIRKESWVRKDVYQINE